MHQAVQRREHRAQGQDVRGYIRIQGSAEPEYCHTGCSATGIAGYTEKLSAEEKIPQAEKRRLFKS